MPTIKNYRIIAFNVPEVITSENAAQATVLQNSELDYICGWVVNNTTRMT